MILGVSHIVLGSTDLERDRRLFEGLGWVTQFEQRGIPTHGGKRPFMSTRSSYQGLVFLQPPQGTPVELIHYADALSDASESPLQIVLPQPLNGTPSRHVQEVPIWPGALAFHFPHVTCPLWFANPAPQPSAIIHHVTDMAGARRFWEGGLGFRNADTQTPLSGVSGMTLLEYRSPVPQWNASLLLVPREGASTPGRLDGPGFRCLSVIASDVKRSAEDLERAGAVGSTGPMDLVINGKPLRLEVLEGPDGVFIEILGTSAR